MKVCIENNQAIAITVETTTVPHAGQDAPQSVSSLAVPAIGWSSTCFARSEYATPLPETEIAKAGGLTCLITERLRTPAVCSSGVSCTPMQKGPFCESAGSVMYGMLYSGVLFVIRMKVQAIDDAADPLTNSTPPLESSSAVMSVMCAVNLQPKIVFDTV